MWSKRTETWTNSWAIQVYAVHFKWSVNNYACFTVEDWHLLASLTEAMPLNPSEPSWSLPFLPQSLPSYLTPLGCYVFFFFFFFLGGGSADSKIWFLFIPELLLFDSCILRPSYRIEDLSTSITHKLWVIFKMHVQTHLAQINLIRLKLAAGLCTSLRFEE